MRQAIDIVIEVVLIVASLVCGFAVIAAMVETVKGLTQ